ncbi:hypothetical protein F503_01025 [Ophiostoma piceae UAMH 11346]|uniref:Uncharacterized protein n=1 Tax=Ophiostoma piceae (strain UAMH 11346) TaxID=1262450 RepID=S3C643_OPHP1|nr:hypothetical protein F503_01025 [Ophiostoma piceae UAMH 11346]
MADKMDIVSDKQMRQIAQQLADGAAEDAAEFLTAASSSQPAAGAAPSAATSATSANKKKVAWNTSKYREEVDVYRARLVDQAFNPADLGDPLSPERPLKKIFARVFPGEAGQFFAELEAQVDELTGKQKGL